MPISRSSSASPFALQFSQVYAAKINRTLFCTREQALNDVFAGYGLYHRTETVLHVWGAEVDTDPIHEAADLIGQMRANAGDDLDAQYALCLHLSLNFAPHLGLSQARQSEFQGILDRPSHFVEMRLDVIAFFATQKQAQISVESTLFDLPIENRSLPFEGHADIQPVVEPEVVPNTVKVPPPPQGEPAPAQAPAAATQAAPLAKRRQANPQPVKHRKAEEQAPAQREATSIGKTSSKKPSKLPHYAALVRSSTERAGAKARDVFFTAGSELKKVARKLPHYAEVVRSRLEWAASTLTKPVAYELKHGRTRAVIVTGAHIAKQRLINGGRVLANAARDGAGLVTKGWSWITNRLHRGYERY